MSTFRQLIGCIKLKLRGTNHIVGWSMTPDEAVAFFKSVGKTVLTFYGYSGMGYEDENGMLHIAEEVLSGYSPKMTLVNIGVTEVGCGAIYPLAKSMGFETAGIVTTLALEYRGGVRGSHLFYQRLTMGREITQFKRTLTYIAGNGRLQ